MDHGPGYVVRMRCGGGGLTYNSHRMTKDEADVIAGGYARKVENNHPGTFLHFESEHGLVRIRSERLTAIEVMRTLFGMPPKDREQAVPASSGVETR